MSKWFVFVKINGEEQRDLMTKFNVSGFPTILFMKPDLNVFHQIGGYEPTDAFVADMEKAKSMAGMKE
jgi:thioredoxin-related protein